MRLAAVLVLVILATATAQATDRRVPVDPNEPPWNAVAKVQTTTGNHCTGALIGPSTVLTAAHCLYNPRTRAMLQPVSLHVLLFPYLEDRPELLLAIDGGVFVVAVLAEQLALLIAGLRLHAARK